MNCLTCKRELNRQDDPTSLDCGGDCLLCMAEAGDPDCVAAVLKLVRDEKLVPIGKTQF